MWTEGCISDVGFRMQMKHATTFIKRTVTWRCFLIRALKFYWDINYTIYYSKKPNELFAVESTDG